jgi:hypothetical protein
VNLPGWIGILVAAVLLTPVMLKMVSRQLNRRLAARLAKGPVGTLMRFDYDYAMTLSRDVFAGELSVEQAAQLAGRYLHDFPGRGPNPANMTMTSADTHKGDVNAQN